MQSLSCSREESLQCLQSLLGGELPGYAISLQLLFGRHMIFKFLMFWLLHLVKYGKMGIHVENVVLVGYSRYCSVHIGFLKLHFQGVLQWK